LVNDNFTDEYYERAWAQIVHSISPQEEERIKQTLSLIPEDCSSVLDVGCGDGRITNRLISCCSKVVGLEQSREALSHVRVERVLGTMDSLPFIDSSFDLVLCCEVLEHLPFKIYPGALEEIQRVTAKYILVTVPNKEHLAKSLVICPRCGCRFSPWRHLRSFNPETLVKLFTGFRLHILRSCQSIKVYPRLLIDGARFVGLLPKKSFPATALCPQCGYHQAGIQTSLVINAGQKSSLLVRLVRPVAKRVVPRRKQATWLMALYQRI